MRKYEQSLEESQKPIGIVIENQPVWDAEEEKVFNFKTRHYNSISKFHDSKIKYLMDQHGTTDKGNCRCCGKKIEPYTEVFYFKEFSYNYWASYKYCADNFYCKECAIENTKTVNMNDYNRAIDKVSEKVIFKDDQEVRIATWGDGTVSEEMTEAEKKRDSLWRALHG